MVSDILYSDNFLLLDIVTSTNTDRSSKVLQNRSYTNGELILSHRGTETLMYMGETDWANVGGTGIELSSGKRGPGGTEGSGHDRYRYPSIRSKEIQKKSARATRDNKNILYININPLGC